MVLVRSFEHELTHQCRLEVNLLIGVIHNWPLANYWKMEIVKHSMLSASYVLSHISWTCLPLRVLSAKICRIRMCDILQQFKLSPKDWSTWYVINWIYDMDDGFLIFLIYQNTYVFFDLQSNITFIEILSRTVTPNTWKSSPHLTLNSFQFQNRFTPGCISAALRYFLICFDI